MLRPLGLMSPMAGLGVIAFATAVIVVLVINATSDQPRVRLARRRMYGAILEMRLFNDDLRAVLRAQLALLKSNGAYLRASLKPLLWLIIPLGLLIAQLDQYYSHAPIVPGQSVLVRAVLRDDADPMAGPHATLASSPGLRVALPGIWFPAAHEVVWNLFQQSAGEYELRVRVGADEIVKTIQVSDRIARASPARMAGWFTVLRNPSEPPLAARSPVKAVLVAYPERSLDVFGWSLHWLVPYAVLSLLFTVGLARLFRVTI